MFRFLITVTLGFLSYFSTDFKIGFTISSAKGFVSLYSGIFKFLQRLKRLNLVPQLLLCLG